MEKKKSMLAYLAGGIWEALWTMCLHTIQIFEKTKLWYALMWTCMQYSWDWCDYQALSNAALISLIAYDSV